MLKDKLKEMICNAHGKVVNNDELGIIGKLNVINVNGEVILKDPDIGEDVYLIFVKGNVKDEEECFASLVKIKKYVQPAYIVSKVLASVSELKHFDNMEVSVSKPYYYEQSFIENVLEANHSDNIVNHYTSKDLSLYTITISLDNVVTYEHRLLIQASEDITAMKSYRDNVAGIIEDSIDNSLRCQNFCVYVTKD